MPRNTLIAFAAATTLAECSSSVSNASAGVAATTLFGNRFAFSAAARNAITPNPNAARELMSCSKPTGITTIKPVIPAICPSLLLASTSPSDPVTVLGTNDDFAIEYVFARTSDANANGNSVSESSDCIMPISTSARKMATNNTTMRCPPRIRSTRGPTNGATMAKGAILTARNKMTLVRAASGLIDKKSESANANVIDVSPATINE